MNSLANSVSEIRANPTTKVRAFDGNNIKSAKEIMDDLKEYFSSLLNAKHQWNHQSIQPRQKGCAHSEQWIYSYGNQPKYCLRQEL